MRAALFPEEPFAAEDGAKALVNTYGAEADVAAQLRNGRGFAAW
ncbi:hypothetical protein [Streptomyces albus]|nr:hypothetical protein [Streptomyces albus]